MSILRQLILYPCRLRLWLLAAVCLLAGGTARGVTADSLIYSFGGPPANPIGELVEAADGVFYGTTSNGGAFGSGTIFKVTAAGVLSTLVEFTDAGAANRGATPGAALINGGDGFFYGTTVNGGTYGLGTVFKMAADGKLTTLSQFSGKLLENRGAAPYAALVLGKDGAFYGTTSEGGYSGKGTVFKITTAGKLTTLVDFAGASATNKGANPYGGLVQDADGNFYGTTSKGGVKGNGTLFKMTAAGVLTTLLEFSDNGATNKGANPYGTLVFGPDQVLYGTTARGGKSSAGTAFKVTTAGVLTTLAQFSGKGAQPESALVAAADGAFYGTTFGGGTANAGTIYRLGSDGALSVLVKFTGKSGDKKGSAIQAGIIKGRDNQFYGATFTGGASDAGTLFKLTAEGALTTLAEFRAPDAAANSQPRLVLGRDKSFYGMTAGNGSGGNGTLYKINSEGLLTTLAEFSGDKAPAKGAAPSAALIQGSDDSYYGVTARGGLGDFGTIFKYDYAGRFSTLVEFTGNGSINKGAAPSGSLLESSDGFFYGTTAKGGAHDLGTIFRITEDGALETLVEFSGNGAANKGAAPCAALILGADGDLYGTTAKGGASDLGTLFKVTSEGALSTLVEFADVLPGKIGAYPCGALALGKDGALYGMTATGGAKGNGTLFKFTAAGGLSTLLEFGDKAVPKGAYPQGALVLGTDGFLYGTTGFGGTSGAGTAFKVSTEGALTTLAEFASGGLYPEGGVIFGTDGNLYGTTSGGGTETAGGIFKLRIRAVPLTGKPGEVQSVSARLNAQINTGSVPSEAAFEFGTTITYGSTTPKQQLGMGSTWTTLAAALTNLLPNTTYHYRTVISDSRGIVTGADATFTTGPLPLKVLATGDPISGEPDSTRLVDFGVPSLGDDASVAVLAGLTTAQGKDWAILAGNPPVIMARKSALAPGPDGATSTARRFVSFSDPVCDSAGRVAFQAKILDGAQARTGIWASGAAGLREVALSGGAVAGVPGATFKAFSSVAVSGQGTLFYVATFAGATEGAPAGVGAWSFDSLGNHLLVRQGMPLSGSTVATFNVLGAVNGSPGQGRALRDGTLSALVTLASRAQAIVHFQAGSLPEVVAATGEETNSEFEPRVLESLGVPSLGAGGTAAFWAKIRKGPVSMSPLNDQSIFADTASVNLAEITRTSAIAPGTGSAVFSAFSDPVYNAQMGAAFHGKISGAGVSPATAAGIWYTRVGVINLNLVARAGGEAAGVAGAAWGAFQSLALPDGSGPLFVAKLLPGTAGTAWPNGVNNANNLGLWSVTPAGVVRAVLRAGDTVQFDGASRTVSLLTVLGPVLGSPGQARAYSGVREVICRATFTDHTQALVRLALP